ncbi:MAG: hypothetical protein IT306_08015 [Chloroflexi bacterium]|nr:hypothetical protein [Chloroflexota bacterium]
MRSHSLMRRAFWMSVTACLLALVTTGCALLDTGLSSAGTLTRSGDGGAPYLVVTVGGSPATTPTLTVAETIPDSTPLPTRALPTPDPNATARPVASPSLAQRTVSNGARASRPPDNLVPQGSPAARAP